MTRDTFTHVMFAVMFVILTLVVPGSNAYLKSHPAAAATVDDQAIEREMRTLNANVERQNELLLRIAVATEK